MPKKYYCIDCGREITEIDVKHGGHRCSKCDVKRFSYALRGKPYITPKGRKCPICKSSNVIIDRDDDQATCPYCGATWESISSFNKESRRKK